MLLHEPASVAARQPVEVRVRALRRVAAAAGAAVVLVSLLVVVGWAIGVAALTRVAPGEVTMKLPTATALGLLGAVIAVTGLGASDRRRLDRGVEVVVGLVAAYTTVTLAEYVTGASFGIDNWFGLDPGDANTPYPGRMAQTSAICIIGLCAAIVAGRRGAVRTSQATAVGVITVGSTALVGYEYGVGTLYHFGPFNSMALPTAALVAVAGCGVLLLHAGEGYAAVVVGETAGGVLLRRLLPWVVIAPNLLGAAIVVGLRHGSYNGPTALSLFVTIIATAGGVVVWLQGELLGKVDVRRVSAEDALDRLREALTARDRVEAELAASERRTRRILSTAADAYVAIDDRGRVTDWNDAAQTLFGWTRAETVGLPLEDLIIPPDLVGDHLAGMARHRAKGAGTVLGTPMEVEAVTRAGGRIPVELTIWAVEDGRSPGFHAFLRDLSNRKRVEQELRAANADLSEFAAIAAHDLRTPLSTVLMQIEILQSLVTEDPGDPDVLLISGRIEKTAKRGVELIDDLLAYASIGREQRAVEAVDLTALARRIADELVAVSPRPATCEVCPLPEVAGDRQLLGQLLGNLIGNALKYVPSGRTPHVVVDAVDAPDERDFVLRVTDNGDGFAPDEREGIFDMFRRGRAGAGLSGTGIGLAICRRVAEQHRGRIWIAPREAGGQICVQLPRWKAAAPRA